MDIINAIAKVRFNSARPQRVQLSKCSGYTCDLLCLEPAQELPAASRCVYYVIAGNGEIRAGETHKPLAMGCFVTCDEAESHTIANSSEQRLICLCVS